MGNAGFPFLPWDSHGNENQIAYPNGNGTEMRIAKKGMGTLNINVYPSSHNFSVLSITCYLVILVYMLHYLLIGYFGVYASQFFVSIKV